MATTRQSGLDWEDATSSSANIHWQSKLFTVQAKGLGAIRERHEIKRMRQEWYPF